MSDVVVIHAQRRQVVLARLTNGAVVNDTSVANLALALGWRLEFTYLSPLALGVFRLEIAKMAKAGSMPSASAAKPQPTQTARAFTNTAHFTPLRPHGRNW